MTYKFEKKNDVNDYFLIVGEYILPLLFWCQRHSFFDVISVLLDMKRSYFRGVVVDFSELGFTHSDKIFDDDFKDNDKFILACCFKRLDRYEAASLEDKRKAFSLMNELISELSRLKDKIGLQPPRLVMNGDRLKNPDYFDYKGFFKEIAYYVNSLDKPNTFTSNFALMVFYIAFINDKDIRKKVKSKIFVGSLDIANKMY